MSKKIITAQDIRDARKAGQTSLTCAADAIVTPQARDDAHAYGITLTRTRADVGPDAVPAATPVAVPEKLQSRPQTGQAPMPQTAVAPGAGFVQNPTPTQPQKPLWDMVREQVAAKLGPAFDAAAFNAVAAGMALQSQSPAVGQGKADMTENTTGLNGVTHIRHRGLPGGSSPASGVILTDVLAPDASGPGVGYLEFASSSHDLTFPAEEVVTVLEGELSVTVQGKTVQARVGEAVRIASGVSVTLSASGPVRCLYTAWPK